MTEQMPAGMMRTKKGTRITVRPARAERVVMIVFGVEITMTVPESRQLRTLLYQSEQRTVLGEGALDG